MLLATKLKNRILLAAKSEDLPLKIELKNIVINGVKRGCSGFVTNMQTGSCVYIDTEKLVYGPLSDKCMYRYARDNKDYSSNGLQNGWNRWATDEELPKQVVRLLREGIGIMR
mgnify:FL=1